MDFLSFPQSRPLDWELRFNRQTLKISSKGGNFWAQVEFDQMNKFMYVKAISNNAFQPASSIAIFPEIVNFHKTRDFQECFLQIGATINTKQYTTYFTLKIENIFENRYAESKTNT